MSARRRLVARVALGGAALAAIAVPPPAGAAVSLSTDPPLHTPFRLDTGEYVARCVPGQPLHFTITATGGDTVAVGGHPPGTGNFTVDVTRQTGDLVGVRVSSGGRTTTHRVRCLPRDFPHFLSTRVGKPQAGWYITTPLTPAPEGYIVIFNSRGTPVWWLYSGAYGPWDGKLLGNGNLIWARQLNDLFSINPNMAWEEHRLDGSYVRELKATGTPTDWHDLEPAPNGHFYVEAYRPRAHVDLSKYGGPKDANVYDGEVQELDANGKRIWSWNSKDHIELSEIRWWSWIHDRQNKKPPAKRIYDLVHVNAVEPDGPDHVIISSRYLDAVFRVRKSDGEIEWKLGGTRRPYSLTVKNDRLGTHPFSGPHDVRKYSDGTVTVYDNGTLEKRPPRAVRYRIDTSKRTATLVEERRDSRILESGWGGSARKLPGGNWVIQWGGTAFMTEQTAKGVRVLEIRYKSEEHPYRTFPVLPGQLSAKALRDGMNAIARSGKAAGPGAAR